MMRGLTLHRPWDWAIAHAGKDVENRPWKPHDAVIGKRIALHAGQKYDYDGAEFIKRTLERKAPLPETRGGLIVATTLVLGWVCIDPDICQKYDSNVIATSPDLASALSVSPWFFGPYGWGLADTIALPKPVRCSGAQGLWSLPADIEAEVLRQEAAAGSKST